MEARSECRIDGANRMGRVQLELRRLGSGEMCGQKLRSIRACVRFALEPAASRHLAAMVFAGRPTTTRNTGILQRNS